MDDFNYIENLWKSNPNSYSSKEEFQTKKIKTNKQKVQFSYLLGSIVLFFIGIANIFIMQHGEYGETKLPTSILFIILSILCLVLGAFFMLYFMKIKKIDETQIPSEHLKNWLNFEEFRRKTIFNQLLVFNILFALIINTFIYFNIDTVSFEKTVISFLSVNIGMILIYFRISKKNIQKQEDRINEIIAELKKIELQIK